MFLDQTEIS